MKNIKYEPLEKMPLGSSWEYPPKKEQIKQALDAYKKEFKKKVNRLPVSSLQFNEKVFKQIDKKRVLSLLEIKEEKV